MSDWTPATQDVCDVWQFSGSDSTSFYRRLEAIKAAAWDEGHHAGVVDQCAWDGWNYVEEGHPTPNPYKDDADG